MAENNHARNTDTGSLPCAHSARPVAQTDADETDPSEIEPPDGGGQRLVCAAPRTMFNLREAEENLKDALLDALNEEIAAFILRYPDSTDRHLADALGKYLDLICSSTSRARKLPHCSSVTPDPEWEDRYEDFCRQLLIARNDVLAECTERYPQLNTKTLCHMLIWWVEYVNSLCLELHNESNARMAEEKQVEITPARAMAANAGIASLQLIKLSAEGKEQIATTTVQKKSWRGTALEEAQQTIHREEQLANLKRPRLQRAVDDGSGAAAPSKRIDTYLLDSERRGGEDQSKNPNLLIVQRRYEGSTELNQYQAQEGLLVLQGGRLFLRYGQHLQSTEIVSDENYLSLVWLRGAVDTAGQFRLPARNLRAEGETFGVAFYFAPDGVPHEINRRTKAVRLGEMDQELPAIGEFLISCRLPRTAAALDEFMAQHPVLEKDLMHRRAYDAQQLDYVDLPGFGAKTEAAIRPRLLRINPLAAGQDEGDIWLATHDGMEILMPIAGDFTFLYANRTSDYQDNPARRWRDLDPQTRLETDIQGPDGDKLIPDLHRFDSRFFHGFCARNRPAYALHLRVFYDERAYRPSQATPRQISADTIASNRTAR